MRLDVVTVALRFHFEASCSCSTCARSHLRRAMASLTDRNFPLASRARCVGAKGACAGGLLPLPLLLQAPLLPLPAPPLLTGGAVLLSRAPDGLPAWRVRGAVLLKGRGANGLSCLRSQHPRTKGVDKTHGRAVVEDGPWSSPPPPPSPRKVGLHALHSFTGLPSRRCNDASPSTKWVRDQL